MSRLTIAIAATVLSGAVAAGGCGVGPGEETEGTAEMRVTSEFGAEEIATGKLEDPTPSDSVVRFLDDTAEIETSYGGNFVESIEGLEGSTTNGGPEDWFFFVNGYYSEVGAGETPIAPGDRIWWDYRDWREAYFVPAVVGSWPAPFIGRAEGDQPDVIVECLTAQETCDDAVEQLEQVGVHPQVETVDAPVEHPEALRLLVGPWDRLRTDPAAALIEAGPSTSGVYGQFEQCGNDDWELSVLGDDGKPRAQLASAGLVAAVRDGQDEPTWAVTGTDDELVAAAVLLLHAREMQDRYAVAVTIEDGSQPLPADSELPVAQAAEECG